MAIKAIIFGSIGTLTETSEMQRQAFNTAFAEHGLSWSWDAASYRSMVAGEAGVVGGGARIADYTSAQGIALDDATVAAIHADKSRIFRETMARDGVALNAGVDALIADARSHGVRVAFASTTSLANIDTMLNAARPSLAGRFDVVLSGEDVERGKPAPDVYLSALDRLGFDSSEVIAIEDSVPSLRSPLAAGIATVVVPGALWRGSDFDGASAVYASLDGIGVAELAAAVGREPVDPAHA